MAYAHTTLTELRVSLAQRLDDTGYAFFQAPEIDGYLNETLRTWNALTGFRRERDTFSTASSTSLYALQTELPALCGYTLTDSNLAADIQYHLLEPSTGTSWTGTDMFTLADLTDALQNRRDRWLVETGMVLTSSSQVTPPPPIGRVALADTTIDVRRLVWEPITGPWVRLWRSDERQMTAFDTGWSVSPGTPGSYSILSTRPVEVQLSPPPSDTGTLHSITVSTGAALDPSAGVVMGIPDDWCWALKWGALADLLAKDGQARDPQRAAYCEARYKQAASLARLAPSVIHAEINGVPVIPQPLSDLDAFSAGWQGRTPARPTDLAFAGHNLVALHPVPNGVYSVTVDVVRRSPTLISGQQVQVGREQLDAILDYGEHLAAFKMGGQEFANTAKLLESFLSAARNYNHRITAAAAQSLAASLTAASEELVRPRTVEGKGVGVLS